MFPPPFSIYELSPAWFDSHRLWVPQRTQSSVERPQPLAKRHTIADMPRQWIFQNAGGDKMYYLKSVGSGQYLSAAGEPRDGQNVIAAGSPYAWRSRRTNRAWNSGVRFMPASNTNFCVDLSDHGNSKPGTPVQMWGRWEGQNQVWRLQKIQ
ncbi:ricin-type beta-trefoil lectin domain-like-domain-containing protein [Lanmaoa asiatica]|nr:ricin-type beta-trefoil lectin domain-like-domain-containing protein [Lanmaoa asiatica]